MSAAAVTTRSAIRSAVAAALAAAALLGSAAPAEAHAVGVSNGAYAVDGETVSAEITLARADVDGLPPERVADMVARGLDVRGDGAPCAAASDVGAPTENDGVLVRARFACARPPRRVAVELRLLDALPHGHRHIARAASAGGSVDDVLFRGHARLAFDAPAASPNGDGADAPSAGARATSAAAFLRMGVEHILTGYDHLLFLFALVLVGGRVRSILAMVTAFTLAHSISLAVSVLGVWVPSPRLVEPLIALSIAYVGVENLVAGKNDGRWRVTFPFGLVHGFGFASALREIELPATKIPVALVSFNAGVELGQLAVLAAVLPIVLWLRTKPAFAGRGVALLSRGVVLAGLVWFAQRVIAG